MSAKCAEGDRGPSGDGIVAAGAPGGAAAAAAADEAPLAMIESKIVCDA